MIDIENIKQAALEALDNMDDYARMECGIEPIGAMNHLTHFINTVCGRLEAAEREISAQNKQLAAKDEWIAAAISKLESAEKDAARYQWLLANRSYFYQMQPDSPSECGIDFQWQQGTYAERNFSVSEAIDGYIEAMKEIK